jgi:transposase InsO family protein
MPFPECSVMSSREEFVRLALAEGSNIRELCRRFGVSSSIAYKWINRYGQEGRSGLADRSRRPHKSPQRTTPDIEEAVLEVRRAHPCWGDRKIKKVLERDVGIKPAPARSTITQILQRHGAIDPVESDKHKAFIRFERAAANELWQIDFKGHFGTERERCHPLTVLDDHARFSICLKACANEQTLTVQAHLTESFRHYGLPWRIISDNGSPWGNGPGDPYTPLGVWLLRLDIAISHSRPYHPQTLGKDERFHRTLKAELLNGRRFADLTDCQRAFDAWREIYNHCRPHQALDMEVPAMRYRTSPRSMPEHLPAIEYAPGDQVRKVQPEGWFSFKSRSVNFPKAFAGYPIALRPTDTDGVWDIFFCRHSVAQVDLRGPKPQTQTARYVPGHLLVMSPA